MKLFEINIKPISGTDLSESLAFDTSLRIAKINTEFLSRSLKSDEFRNTLNSFDLKFADGVGVLWAAKYLSLPLIKIPILRQCQALWQMAYTGAAIIFYPKYLRNPLPEAIPGVEALKIMLKSAEEKGAGAFFFGATQKDLDGAIKNIKNEFPKLKIEGSLNGYDWQEDNGVDPVSLINRTDAKLLIVALGSPLQEYWIRDNFDKLKNVKVAVGEGGSLAFLSGTLKRPPGWINKIGLEWLWRLFMNRSLTHQTGSRLRRVWNSVPVFIFKTVNWKIKNV